MPRSGPYAMLWLRTWYGVPHRLQDPEYSSKTVCVPNSLVHAIPYSERVYFALLIEQQRLRLRISVSVAAQTIVRGYVSTCGGPSKRLPVASMVRPKFSGPAIGKCQLPTMQALPLKLPPIDHRIGIGTQLALSHFGCCHSLVQDASAHISPNHRRSAVAYSITSKDAGSGQRGLGAPVCVPVARETNHTLPHSATHMQIIRKWSTQKRKTHSGCRNSACAVASKASTHLFGSIGSTLNTELSFKFGKASRTLKDPKARTNSSRFKGPMMGATN
jgi:hypothetical protein